MSDSYVVKAKLLYDIDFLQLAILKLYERQQQDEQGLRTTWHNNGEGFNKPDAGILSGYAEILKGGSQLTQEQVKDASKRMTKYVNQLLSILSPEELE